MLQNRPSSKWRRRHSTPWHETPEHRVKFRMTRVAGSTLTEVRATRPYPLLSDSQIGSSREPAHKCVTRFLLEALAMVRHTICG